MWAYVFFAKTLKYSVVNVESINNFNRDEPFSDKKVYSLELADGSQGKCQVLLLAGTVERLNELIEAKRVSVPKLSQSMYEDEPDADARNAKKTQKAPMKKRRNEQSQNRKSASREQRESIVAAHINSKQGAISGPAKERGGGDDIDMFPPGKKPKTSGSGKKLSKPAVSATLTGDGNKERYKSKIAGPNFENSRSQSSKVAASTVSNSGQVQRAKTGVLSRDETVDGVVTSITPRNVVQKYGTYGSAEEVSEFATIGTGEGNRSKNVGSQSSGIAALTDLHSRQAQSGDSSGDETIFTSTERNVIADGDIAVQPVDSRPTSPDMFESQKSRDSMEAISDAECGHLQHRPDPTTDKRVSNMADKDDTVTAASFEIKQLKNKVQALSEKCSKLREIGLQLRDSYHDLKDSEGFTLTEATGKEIVALMKELKSLRQEATAGFGADESSLMEKVNVTSSSEVKRIVLEECKRVRTPSKFVTTIAYGLWGYEALSVRVVRQQTNTSSKLQLTPTKKEYVARKLGEWLAERDYGKKAILLEMENLNSYLGRAITGAQRHLKKNPGTNSHEESGNETVDEDGM